MTKTMNIALIKQPISSTCTAHASVILKFLFFLSSLGLSSNIEIIFNMKSYTKKREQEMVIIAMTYVLI